MIARTTARRLLAFVIALAFAVSAAAPAALAQRRRTRARAAASPGPKFPRNLPEWPKRVRPPRTYDVQHYIIRTRFDVPNKTVIGDTTVVLKPLSAGFDSFELDASNMKIEAVTLGDAGTPLQWTQPPDKLAVKLARAYGPADTVAVRISYRANPERGLYFVPGGQGGGGAWTTPAQIWSQGEPEDNHYWFPAYDYPDDHATSEQYITTGAGEIAVSNGALVETTANADGTRTFH